MIPFIILEVLPVWKFTRDEQSLISFCSFYPVVVDIIRIGRVDTHCEI
jgi:hypothetical protein